MIKIHAEGCTIKGDTRVIVRIDNDSLELIQREITPECYNIALGHLTNDVMIIMSKESETNDYFDVITCCDFELDTDDLDNNSYYIKNYNTLFNSVYNHYDLLKFKIKTHQL